MKHSSLSAASRSASQTLITYFTHAACMQLGVCRMLKSFVKTGLIFLFCRSLSSGIYTSVDLWVPQLPQFRCYVSPRPPGQKTTRCYNYITIQMFTTFKM